ncbi:acetyl-CoA synthetase-like protein [Daedalea quercina L-15889]|uniref:Acetyl-CoA synthetase-like protein n=1 Tax=Daedalea quercina L-15889 TaxID=1314783 RepID=A0A165TBC8_9APHY|nr:acetyl-CoA synthetase-like protein [Daedalea quercina L-15889]
MTLISSLPAPPHTQGLSSVTFKNPPLDGTLSLPELCDWHGQHSPDHRLFVYAEDDGTIKNVKWARASEAIRRSAQLVRERLGWTPGTSENSVVAILSASDSIPYVTTTLGVIRANYVAFPISTRNSPAAVAHLIEKTGVRHILVGREHAMQELAAQSLEVLKAHYGAVPEVELSPMPIFDDLYSSGQAVPSEDVPYERWGPDTPALILHSSGSTTFPKPIYCTLHRLLQFVRVSCYGGLDLADKILSLHGSPMYHGMGFTITTLAISSGLCVALPAPRHPPLSVTPESTIRGATATHSEIILAVPSMLEAPPDVNVAFQAWSRNPDYVESLSNMNRVLYGGGPLDKEVGEYLFSHGVPLCCEYGSTECGVLSCFLPLEIPDVDWHYVRFADNVTVKFEPFGLGQYECIILANELLHPHVINTKVDGVDGYATSDLFEEHPTKKGYWRILGRTDDQIMHSTGEKTNPGPLESMMNQDPHVAASVMFGRGRFQAGILVEPKPEYRFNPVDENELTAFRNKLWPTVQKMNAFAPQHSRLFKEVMACFNMPILTVSKMILVAKPNKPFVYTAKHTVRRGVVTKVYEEEINTLYTTIDTSAQVSISYPMQWRLYEATGFVRSVVSEIMGRNVPDDGDFFQNGCDSLQATYIRNALLSAIRKSSKVNAHSVPESLVYDNPTISCLGAIVSSIVLGTRSNESGNIHGSSTARIDSMRAMVTKYTSDFPKFIPGQGAASSDPGDVVLVTGTTGSLGCHVLVQLATSPEVRRIYALNRPSRNADMIRPRQEKALLERGLNAEILDSDRVVLLEGDLMQPKFGLSVEVFDEMRASITHIIHNAWPVDFALKLASFEPQIQGIRALIDFALAVPMHPEPPHVQFTSSVGVVQNMSPEMLCAETSVEPDNVVSTGYAESKWVSEQILYSAAAKTPLRALVVRAGQICGGPDGAWNSHEWLPSMVQSAPALGCFPDDTRAIDWIPADLAAAAVVDFRKYTSPTHTVHLVHPRPVSWRSLATYIAGEFSVPLVPYSAWLAKLEEYSSEDTSKLAVAPLRNDAPHGLHASRLLSFFRSLASRVGSGPNALGMVNLDLKQALIASPALADPEIRRLRMQDAQRWLAYWQKTGVFF